MTTITYTAAREIVPHAYLVTGTDISASSTDDSFNSTTTDLTGIAVGEWLYITGFTDEANNGWHQVATVATNKITVNETLVTEVAGASMTLNGYEHGLGASYQLESAAWVIQPEDVAKRNDLDSLNGTPETILHRIDMIWSIQTDIIQAAQLPYWREFLQSVIARETFTLDPYGTIASPDNPVSVVLVDKSLSLLHVQSSMIRQLSFKVRQL